MILLVNNSNNVIKLSYINKLRNALSFLKIPYFEIDSLHGILDDNIKKKIKGIILSGSSMKLTKQMFFKEFVHDIHYLVDLDVPVLGICFGCQLLTTIYGGKLHNRKNFLCETIEIEVAKNMLFENLTNKRVQFCFSDLPSISKDTTSKEIAWLHINGKKYGCAFEFKKNKYYGCLFHPEYHESSYQILYNFAHFAGSV